MISIYDIQRITSDSTTLQNYLSDNFQEVYDFFNHTSHRILIQSKEEINEYIHQNRSVILGLDLSNKTNLSFICLLIDISERLSLIASFKFLYDHLKRAEDYYIGTRLQAASLYLTGISDSVNYFTGIYNDIYNHLQTAYETEEDSTDLVLMTFVNYYAFVIQHFGEFNVDAVQTIRNNIENSRNNFRFSFLNHPLINNIFNIDLSDFSSAYQSIHNEIDIFLARDIAKPYFQEEFLIEHDTEYCNLLRNAECNFNSILRISIDKHQKNLRRDEIFHSLLRGTKILETYEELYAYFNSFALRHYDAIIDALSRDIILKSVKKFCKNGITIVDWGCGQGLATIGLFGFYESKKNKTEN